jgi:LDH2 family malate/lactate/ureidoglycolate dehydrogenase
MADQTVTFVAYDELERFCAACFQKIGLPPADAELTAQSLVWASLRGVDSHGLILVKEYAERVRLGGIDPTSSYSIVTETATTAVLDAAGGVGQIAASRAMDVAIKKAAESGMGMVGVKNSNHFGATAFYAVKAVERDMIGLASTNAPPTMAPSGGKARLLGTNPFAIAVPAQNDPPLVLDMSTSASAWGKVFIAMQQGQKIPLTWVLDKDGHPTDDPAKAIDGGFIQPLGGYKGYGLSLMVDIFSGVLTGSAFSNHIPPWSAKDQMQRCGHLLAAIKIDGFMPVPEFHARVNELIEFMKSSPLAAGSDRVFVPGEIESETEKQRRAQGIPLQGSLKQDLATLGQELGVEVPF